LLFPSKFSSTDGPTSPKVYLAIAAGKRTAGAQLVELSDRVPFLIAGMLTGKRRRARTRDATLIINSRATMCWARSAAYSLKRHS
jgi:hypothetical protein